MPSADFSVGSITDRPVAVIDIGSNSIRLVVYDGRARTPIVLLNEKSVCALATGLEASGRLNPEGVPAALAVLGRFSRLTRAMGVGTLAVLATAAVREAVDGPEFVARIERECGFDVTVITGAEEAKLSAQGVLCGTPDADGLVADLGGGSLELASIEQGAIKARTATLPLGLLRLSDAADHDLHRAAKIVDRHFSGVDWLPEGKNRALYVVGGVWRSLALLLIEQTDHPLHVLDNYTLERAEALRLINLIARQSPKSLEKITGLSRKRVPYLPMAALLLEKLMLVAQPSRLIFSVWGMREGRFFRLLPPDLQKRDPLIAACARLAQSYGRFPEHGEEVLGWMAPLFPKETNAQRRLRHACCLLGDLFWNEHPDFRAEQSFRRVIRLPVMSLAHRERAALALTVYARYQGDDDDDLVAPAVRLLSDDERRRARLIGQLLRLGHMISGGVPGLLGVTRLVLEKDVLALEVPRADSAFSPGMFDRRMDKLARMTGRDRFEFRRV